MVHPPDHTVETGPIQLQRDYRNTKIRITMFQPSEKAHSSFLFVGMRSVWSGRFRSTLTSSQHALRSITNSPNCNVATLPTVMKILTCNSSIGESVLRKQRIKLHKQPVRNWEAKTQRGELILVLVHEQVWGHARCMKVCVCFGDERAHVRKWEDCVSLLARRRC